jgi:hypothetical protein
MDAHTDGLITELYARATIVEHYTRALLVELGQDTAIGAHLRDRLRQTHEHARVVSQLVLDLASAEPVAVGVARSTR